LIEHEKLSQSDVLYGSKVARRKKVDVNRHFQASSASHRMGYVLVFDVML